MIDLATDALATFRITRLISRDAITAPLRDSLIRHLYAERGDSAALRLAPAADVDWTERAKEDGELAPFLARLVTCGWCSGMYVAFGVMAARLIAPKVWQPISTALACASAAGLLSTAEQVAQS